MRTLKKSLCLVLALVMVLGLCVFGTNAAYAEYTDLADVTYEEAVEVLSGLEVIEGYPDGTFKPAENVTRAEAAAMIARMMLGREKADKLPIGDVKFSDVPETNWAAKYIAFCANRGIIVGMGDGTFRPSENITGTQMATMLLRALGYGVMGEYEGKGWDINAVADALYYKVFEDSKVTDFNQAATREETALYIWNTMWIQLVGYDVDLNYYDGRQYREDGRYYPLTFAREAFNLEWDENLVVIANQATGSEYTVVASLDDDGSVSGLRNLNITTDLSYIGRDVDAFYDVDEKDDKVNHKTYNDAYLITIESVPFDKGDTLDDFYRAAKDANKANLSVKFGEVPLWMNYDYVQCFVYTDLYGVADVTDADGNAVIADGNDATRLYTYVEEVKGQKSSKDYSPSGEWILDRDGKIMLILDSSYLVGKVLNVDNGHDEVEIKCYLETEYNPDYTVKAIHYDTSIYDMAWNDTQLVYDGIAKDDFVQVVPVGNLFYVNPTTTKTVDITEKNSDYYTFNNYAFWYDGYGYGIEIPDSDSLIDVGVGDKVKFYVIEGIAMFGADSYFGLEIVEKAKTEGIIYVVSVGDYIDHSEWDTTGAVNTVTKVQGINQDGEEVVYKITAKDIANGIVPPTAGTVVEVRKQGDSFFFDSSVKNIAFLKNDGTKSSYLKSDSDTYYVTEDTKVIYFTGSGKTLDITVTNKLAKDTYDVYAITKKSGGSYKLNTVWVLNASVEAPDDFSDESIVYVANKKYGGTSPSGSEAYNGEAQDYYNVYVDGAKKKCYLTSEEAIFGYGGMVIYGFYQAKDSDGDGIIELKSVKPEKIHKAVTLSNGSVKYGKLYAEKSDGIELKVTVVDVTKDTTTDTKTDASVNSVERLEELLSEGYEIRVDYMFITDTEGNEIPVGAMYVTKITSPDKIS